MRYFRDPSGRMRPIQPNRQGGNFRPTLEDFQRLAGAFEEQTQRAEKLEQALQAKSRELAALTQTLEEVRRELGIKQEALTRQSADLKQTEAELMWARAAVAQNEKAQEDGDDGTWRDRYTRLQAELENLRKRWEQRAAADTESARQEILRDMLPLADHLELALQHGKDLPGDQARDYVGNIAVTHQAFLGTLRRYGVTPLDALSQPFDPNLHEAVGEMTDTALPAGVVAHVVQTGYMDGEKLLRPARVLVSA
jgi:molecular chaperone GrpE